MSAEPGPLPPLLLEREEAQATLQEGIDAACACRGMIVVVEGLPGLGKSALVAAARQLAAHSGLRVLSARGSQLESSYGFGVVRQLLEPAVREAAAHAGLFAGEARFAERVLSLAAEGPAPDPFAVLQALHRVIIRLSDERPALITVDDAHWADEPSLQFLAFLQNRIQQRPLAVVVTTRPAPVDAGGALGQLARAADRQVRLKPLSADGTAALVRRVLPTAADSMCSAVHTATGGNPFYAGELARQAQRHGSPWLRPWAAGGEPPPVDELRRTVARRVTALGEEAVALVRAVYVLGREARLRLIARLANLDIPRAEAVLRDVVASGVLTGGQVPDFVHPLAQDAVGAVLVGDLEADLRLQAARILVEAGSDLEHAAGQLLAAEPTHEPWVLDTLLAAARQAGSRGAPAAAATYLRRALCEPSAQRSPAVLLDLGRHEFLCGDPAAVTHLRHALEQVQGDEQLAVAALALARALSHTGDFSGALEVLVSTRARVEDATGDAAVRLDMEAVSLARLDLAAAPQADAILSRYGPRDGHRAVDQLVNANLCIEPARRPGTAAQAAGLAHRALRDGLLLDDQTSDSHIVSYPVIALFVSDHLDAAEQALADMAADAERRGSAVGRTNALCWGAHLALRAGNVLRAEAQARAALESVKVSGFALLAPYAISFLCDALVEKGELVEAAALWPAAGLDGDLPPVLPVNYVLYSRGVLRLATGQPGPAVADLQESGRRQELWGVHNPAFWPWGSQAAVALHQLGRVQEARDVAARELAVARDYGAGRAVGIALRALALVTPAPENLSLLREAVEVLRTSPARIEYARASVELGAALRRDGHRNAARDHLATGLDLAVRCGAAPLVRRARQELAAAGVRPRRPGATGVAALTASERRVAELAAAGRTNREIARELFVAVKTVETHMHSVLRKLHVGSRSELMGVDGLRARHD